MGLMAYDGITAELHFDQKAPYYLSIQLGGKEIAWVRIGTDEPIVVKVLRPAAINDPEYIKAENKKPPYLAGRLHVEDGTYAPGRAWGTKENQ